MIKFNPGLTESYFISSFVSGLKEEIRPLIKIFKPTSLDQGFEQAKLQKQFVQAILKKQRTYFKPYSPVQSRSFSSLKQNKTSIKTLPTKELEKPPTKTTYNDLKKGGSVLVFFYDILVYGRDIAEHLQHLSLVFEVMRKEQL